MSDCANIEMRELLPDLLQGRLTPVLRARVEAHLSACEDCASELELLRATRAAFVAPPIDMARIAASVAGATRQRRSRPAAFGGWRVAAAITVISLGGLSLAVARHASVVAPADRADTAVEKVVAPAPLAPRANDRPATASRPPATGRVATAAAAPSTDSSHPAPATARTARPRITFGGGLADLSDDELVSLLGSVGRMSSTPSTEPEHITPPGTSGGIE